MSLERFDGIVIGAGQGGGPLSTAFARAGRRMAIVERALVGGSCINYGCTPTKTMAASARVAYLARRAADYGVRAGEVSVGLAAVRERKRRVVERFRGGSQAAIEKMDGVELLFGHATFTGPRELAVRTAAGERRLAADLVVINVGARSAPPRIQGLGGDRVLDSTTIMELGELPEHLIVIGGGYVGVEFAQMFRRFGSRVTLVQRGAQLLAKEDQDVAAAVAGVLREDGVDVLLEARPRGATMSASGAALAVRTPRGDRVVTGTHVLAATGRRPNTDDLGLGAGGIAHDERGFVRVNDRLETNVPGVYAIGDANGGPAFTHVSYDDFRIVYRNLIERRPASTAGRLVPYTVFMDPQLGRVGMTEREARAAGRPVEVAKLPMEHVARAIEMDERRGFIKAVVDLKTEQILGAAVLGVEGGELMAMLEIAMLGKLSFHVLGAAVFAHPTLAESLNNLFTPLREKR
ncbi:MAG: mercuric reductase [Candidatus Limnocylindria bacterium]